MAVNIDIEVALTESEALERYYRNRVLILAQELAEAHRRIRALETTAAVERELEA